MLSPKSDIPVDVTLVCYDQEPVIVSFIENLLEHILEQKTWSPNHIVFINTELDSTEKDVIIDNSQFIDCYYFHHAFAASDWYRGYQYLSDLTPPVARTINKKFITFNRITSSARIYRSLLVNELIERDILDQGHVSFSRVCPNGLHFDNELRSYGASIHLPTELIESAITNISNVTDPLRIDFKDDPTIPNNSFHMSAVPENMESFLHVVTETCYWGRKKHLTEKIFKPIVMRQPFVLVGCAHNLEYLKSYGFKTFDRWWDESYDRIEDDVERMHAIGQLLAGICKNDLGRLKEILTEMEEVLEYNYRWFYNQEFLTHCWDELVSNLTTAIRNKP